MDWELMYESLPMLLEGAVLTIELLLYSAITGLIVAIPLLLCYTWLLAKTHRIIEGVDEISTKFINLTGKLNRTQKETGRDVAPAAR